MAEVSAAGTPGPVIASRAATINDQCCLSEERSAKIRSMPQLSALITALAAAYPPELAESWDAVGLVCGDPAEDVNRVLVCVDPVADTVNEALELGAQLIVAHHPLLLRGVHGVAADTTK